LQLAPLYVKNHRYHQIIAKCSNKKFEVTVASQPDNFWQDHSLNYLEMAFRTDRKEAPRHFDGYGKKGRDCGDTIEFFIDIQGDRICKASYMTNGCLNTNACANTVLNLIEGKTICEAWKVTPEKVAEYLQTLPKDHFHCAELSVDALYLSLANAVTIQRSSWKKMYR
jgi:nitrogen fixation NifU-like protein